MNVDLAPVMDVVPRSLATRNFIATTKRNFGWTRPVVAAKGSAFTQGMKASGLALTVKHFPGLGHVTANTDTSASVTDTVTTRTSTDLRSFTAAVAAGAPFVMVSSATYRKIDASHPAAFSKIVINGVLRGDLGFGGVVMSDDFGNAKAVQRWAPGTRAVNFLFAGGDIVLTGNGSTLPAMVGAVTARASSDAGFRTILRTRVLRVLTAKAAAGPARDAAADGRPARCTRRCRHCSAGSGGRRPGPSTAALCLALQTRVGADRGWRLGPGVDGGAAVLPRHLPRRGPHLEQPHRHPAAEVPDHPAVGAAAAEDRHAPPGAVGQAPVTIHRSVRTRSHISVPRTDMKAVKAIHSHTTAFTSPRVVPPSSSQSPARCTPRMTGR